MRDYYSLLRYLKKNLKLPRPVSVRRVKMPAGSAGDCSYHKRRFYIRIERTLPEFSAMETLMHELGHCLAWHDDNHGRDWGAAYSKTFRTYLNWIAEEEENEEAA